MPIPIFPSAYILPWAGGVFNPYFGGFGHFNKSGPLLLPYTTRDPWLYALAAGFLA